MIIENGINVSLMHDEPETLYFKSMPGDSLLFQNEYGSMTLKRLQVEMNKIDSNNLKSWTKDYISNFLQRAELANSQDLRTEEEKLLPELGVVSDDFEKIDTTN